MTPTNTSALPFQFKSNFGELKPVWAHWFPTFPEQVNNLPATTDYYNANYLNPQGEGGKWAAVGGFLRSRPLPVPLNPSTHKKIFFAPNFEREIRMAICRGLTGFCADILSVTEGLTGYLPQLLQAAENVDDRFKIIPMIDMGMTSVTPSDVAEIILNASLYKTVMRLPDQRILFSAYNAPVKDLAWWTDVINRLNKQSIYVAFMPVLLGGPKDAGPLNPISYAVGAWGTATPGPSEQLNPTAAHAAGLKFMSPVNPQQSRPKSKQFWEAANTLTFRNAWLASINTECDYVQCITWNDFSEASQVTPCTDATFNPSIGTGFYDLMAYYATWFATGWAPEITQDVLYFCYRRATSHAIHPNQADNFTVVTSGGPPEEYNIELLAFLTEPGHLKINSTGMDAPAGITSFKIKMHPGIPTFTLQRNGSTVIHGAGSATIYADDVGLPSGCLDMTYLSGSLTTHGLTSYSWTEAT